MNLATNIDTYATDPTMVARSRKLTSLLGWSVENTVMPAQALDFTNSQLTRSHGDPCISGNEERKFLLDTAVRCVRCFERLYAA